jgi:hypothetical protein
MCYRHFDFRVLLPRVTLFIITVYIACVREGQAFIVLPAAS